MWWTDTLNTVHANQIVIMRLLLRILAKDTEMAVDLTTLTQEVTNNTSVTQSVVQLLQNLQTIIQNIPPSTDSTTQAALDQLTATLKANDTTIANAVVANTPK